MSSIRSFLCMTLVAIGTFLSAAAWSEELSQVSGHVLDDAQQPIAQAQVFMEQGLLSPVVRVITNEEGYFEFNHVLPGTVGVLAHASGRAFNGFSLKIGTGDLRSNTTIVLKPAGHLSGRVIGLKKKSLGHAYITHVLLQHAKVTIPYAKLRNFGFNIPSTDEKGRFTLRDIPEDETIALKVSHGKHAQGVVTGIDVGTSDATVSLTPGVLVSGTIQAQGSDQMIPKAAIIFRNNHPPYATTITRAGNDGVYVVRLKPGDYTYESIGSTYTSVSKPRIIISGQRATEAINLRVAPKVTVHGKVMDAVTGKGIAGARVRLETQGKLNAFATTGTQGSYSFSAPAGQATIRFLEAAGYRPPPTTSFGIPVAVGEDPPTPTFWITPLPTYSLAVVDGNQTPIAQAVVQVLDPPQIGWRTTDAQGMVDIRLGTLPESGRVVGYIEHPTEATGTAFSIVPKDSHEAIVPLTRLRTIHGRVINDQGKSLAGWTVSCQIIPEGAARPITLWSTVTNSAGRFEHPGVLEGTPLLYSASYAHEDSAQVTAPALFTVHENSLDTLPDLVAQDGESGTTFIGKKFPWRTLEGKGLDEIANRDAMRTVIFVASRQAALVLESLEQQQKILSYDQTRLVLVIDGAHAVHSDSIPVGTGKAPGPATVYIVSPEDRVLAEGYELPTSSLLRNPPSRP